jgi:hypothetical protein
VHVGLDEALPPVLDAHELDVVVLGQAFENCTADDRVQSRTVATAGEDSDLHPLIMPCFPASPVAGVRWGSVEFPENPAHRFTYHHHKERHD